MIIDGLTFRRYRTENASPTLISNDGKIMVEQGQFNASYAPYILPIGPVIGANLQPKLFRNEARACSEAVELLKIMQAAESNQDDTW